MTGCLSLNPHSSEMEHIDRSPNSQVSMNRDDGALASAFNEKNVGEVDLWTALAGPAAFGRSLMIAPGVHIPSPWKNAEKLRLNGVTLQNPATLQRVRHAFLTRTPIVYEVEPEP